MCLFDTKNSELTKTENNQITAWKAQLLEGAAGVFGSGPAEPGGAATVDLKTLHAKIGELALENDFLSGALSNAGLLSAKRFKVVYCRLLILPLSFY